LGDSRGGRLSARPASEPAKLNPRFPEHELRPDALLKRQSDRL